MQIVGLVESRFFQKVVYEGQGGRRENLRFCVGGVGVFGYFGEKVFNVLLFVFFLQGEKGVVGSFGLFGFLGYKVSIDEF